MAGPVGPALAAYLILTALLFRAGLRELGTANVGGPGDPPLEMWFLAWTPYALSHGLNPFFSDYVNHPAGINLMWNTLMLLPGLVLSPVTLSLGPVAAYNVLVTLNVALSAWTAYLAVRRLVPVEAAALLGGLVYGFGPYMMAQSHDHPNLTAAYLPPLLLIVLHQLWAGDRWPARRAGLCCGLLALAQLFITEELLASEVLMAAVGGAILALSHPRAVARAARRTLTAAGWAVAVFVPPAAWPLAFQFFGPQRVSGVLQPRDFYVTDLANFVVPTEVQQLASEGARQASASWTGDLSEMNGYIGLPLLALVAYLVVTRRRAPLVRFAALLGAAAAVLSLGVELHVGGHSSGVLLPFALIEGLPVLGNLLPNRLMLYADLMLALLTAVAAAGPAGEGGRVGRWSGLGLALLAAAPLLPALDYPAHQLEVPPFFAAGGDAASLPERGVVLVTPFQHEYPAEPMLWQAATGMRFKMPFGYFVAPDAMGRAAYGVRPSTLSETLDGIQNGQGVALDRRLADRLLTDLAALQVGGVVVGPETPDADRMQGFFTDLLGRPPEDVGGVLLWPDLDPAARRAEIDSEPALPTPQGSRLA